MLSLTRHLWQREHPGTCYCCGESKCLHKFNSRQWRARVWESQNWVINNPGLQDRKTASLKAVHQFLGSFSAFQYYAASLKVVWPPLILHNSTWHLTWICFSRLDSDILSWKLFFFCTFKLLSQHKGVPELFWEHWMSVPPKLQWLVWSGSFHLRISESAATRYELMGLCQVLGGTNRTASNNYIFFLTCQPQQRNKRMINT